MISASAIATKDRSLYDVFALPCSPQSYIPNERVRKLLRYFETLTDVDSDVVDFEFSLRNDLHALNSWQYSSGGSETNLNDPNLAKYLGMIKDQIDESHLTNGTIPFDLILAGQKTQSEYRIEWGQYFLIASEAKGVEHSQYEGLVQGFQVGGDSCVYMWRCGLDSKLAVTPVVLSYSDCFCIYAVYLIPDCYPVLVQLSPPLTYLTYEGRCCLARWGIALRRFARETQKFLCSVSGRGKDEKSELGLYIADRLFFKPLREFQKTRKSSGDSSLDIGSNLRINLESMMMAYHRLHAVDNAHQFFLFPLGVISYPSNMSSSFNKPIRTIMETCIRNHFINPQQLLAECRPVIVFEELTTSEGWSNGKPRPEQVPSYVKCVKEAVDILNAANIAHMDLRPANIMWRIDPTGADIVEIRVIDLEDAVPFGFNIRFVDNLRNDVRYPVLENDERKTIPACRSHNDWFCESITAWAEQNEIDSHTDYMTKNSHHFESILQRVKINEKRKLMSDSV